MLPIASRSFPQLLPIASQLPTLPRVLDPGSGKQEWKAAQIHLGCNVLILLGNSPRRTGTPQAFEIARQFAGDSHRDGMNNPLMLRAIWDGQAGCYA